MSVLMRLGTYVVGLVVVFAAAAGIGRAAGPVARPVGGSAAPHAEHDPAADTTARHSPLVDPPLGARLPGGLQAVQDGYRLQPLTTSLTAATATEFAFRVLRPDGVPVTRYAPTHERNLHLIVVRRDLTGYQHLHPQLGGDGTWRTPVTVATPGQYRVFADFQPAERAEPLTLGVDVPVPGDYQPVPLPVPSRTATVDGYTVELAGTLIAGDASRLTVRVSREGRAVTDLQPYLGAYGHLVVLRDGDLAYLHVHPDAHPDAVAGPGTSAGPEVTFHVDVPSDGTYRLFLDFQHAGRVHTAEFTAATDSHAADHAGTPGGDSHDDHD